ncbi:MAG: nickel pincer cofactor biosynthesis protein LarB [Nitrospirae bacterium]|nr:nickel pincer cofactor biosynthesis protein LarB [Nitrospirota bacterium]MCL5238271.1 nickel pincer cofactor biosynthesis protein LarB [Nitrospirota bacterium]
MDTDVLKKLLADVKAGRIPVEKALHKLKHLPYEDLEFAKVDHHRGIRSDIPEVIYARGKKTEEVIAIARSMLEKSGRFLITKASENIYRELNLKNAEFSPASGIISYGGRPRKKGSVLVISAGTSDIPVAEESQVTASFLGSRTGRLYDVGVAGIHRLFSRRELMAKARVIVVVAGMEGALPSVVGGLTDKPVVAVPTSVGYGTSLGGLTALFAMLNSCVPGMAVVNIDNGFGAGCLAHKINMMGLK